MFTCSSGVSFLRNFPKNRVHDAASHSLFCLHFRCFTPFRCVLVNPSVFSIVLSFACGDGGVVGFCFFVPAPVYWYDPRGFVLHGLRKNFN